MSNIDFNTGILEIDNFKEVVVEVEDYFGNTIQGFKFNLNKNNEISTDICYENNEFKSLSDLGVTFKMDNNKLTFNYDKYCVADVDEDYLFDSDASLIRLQKLNFNWNKVKDCKHYQELNLNDKTIDTLEFTDFSCFNIWSDIIEKINTDLLNNIDIDNLEKVLTEYKEIDTSERVLSNCVNYYTFDKDANIYKVFYGWDEQFNESFNNIEIIYTPMEFIEKYN